jgi:ubiquinone biosynthesis protein UbiJ
MPATPVWLAAIESVLNRSIDRSQRAGAAARRLDRTSLQLDIEGIARIRASVCASHLALSSDGDPGADAIIAGPPSALLSLLAQGRAAGAAPDRTRTSVRISGDADVASGYRELLALARPDLEEELSRLVGDLAARRLSLAAQGALGWLRRLGRTAGENLAEYLQEESRDVVGKYEVEEFVQGVDRLRDTADRVEARLARIEQRLKGAV